MDLILDIHVGSLIESGLCHYMIYRHSAICRIVGLFGFGGAGEGTSGRAGAGWS